ncbi:MAG: NUDIX domain-containing protein [Nanoarchaeota archaeon]|nr:NUDIX domain-containing protein [Nanoarchaeota archaeon]
MKKIDYKISDSSFIFLKKEDKLLMYLRDNNPYIIHPEHWALIGGGIEKYETPLEGLLREIREEINCSVKNISFIGKIDVNNLVYNNQLLKDHKLYFFKGDIEKEIKEIKLTEGQRLGYFTFDEFEKLKVSKLLKDFILVNKNIIF